MSRRREDRGKPLPDWPGAKDGHGEHAGVRLRGGPEAGVRPGGPRLPAGDAEERRGSRRRFPP